MYKLINSLLSNGNSVQNTVKRLSDGTIIPYNTANTDYQAYLKWLDEGNTPEAASDSVDEVAQ
jgi:hypothetical protein